MPFLAAEVRRALAERLQSWNAKPGLLERLAGAGPRTEHKILAEDWTVEFFPDAEGRLERGDIEVYSELGAPPRPEYGAGPDDAAGSPSATLPAPPPPAWNRRQPRARHSRVSATTNNGGAPYEFACRRGPGGDRPRRQGLLGGLEAGRRRRRFPGALPAAPRPRLRAFPPQGHQPVRHHRGWRTRASQPGNGRREAARPQRGSASRKKARIGLAGVVFLEFEQEAR